MERQVLAAVRPCIGQRLLSAFFCCLADPDECTEEELNDPDFYVGGEVRLVFEPNVPLFVTFEQGAGWELDLSLQARSTTASIPGALKQLDASETDVWKEHIGRRLRGVRVHGSCRSPLLLELRFREKSVLVGVGFEGKLCDGTDTMVRSGEHLERLADFEVLGDL